jgi:hypothetical protein
VASASAAGTGWIRYSGQYNIADAVRPPSAPAMVLSIYSFMLIG